MYKNTSYFSIIFRLTPAYQILRFVWYANAVRTKRCYVIAVVLAGIEPHSPLYRHRDNRFGITALFFSAQ